MGVILIMIMNRFLTQRFYLRDILYRVPDLVSN